MPNNVEVTIHNKVTINKQINNTIYNNKGVINNRRS